MRHFIFSCRYAFHLWLALLSKDADRLNGYAFSLLSKQTELRSLGNDTQ